MHCLQFRLDGLPDWLCSASPLSGAPYISHSLFAFATQSSDWFGRHWLAARRKAIRKVTANTCTFCLEPAWWQMCITYICKVPRVTNKRKSNKQRGWWHVVMYGHAWRKCLVLCKYVMQSDLNWGREMLVTSHYKDSGEKGVKAP